MFQQLGWHGFDPHRRRARRPHSFPTRGQRKPQQRRRQSVTLEVKCRTTTPKGLSVVSNSLFISGVKRPGTYQLSASDSTCAPHINFTRR